MNKKPEVTARTRQNLIDAFWSLYCEKRIEKITVKEITNRAGYNRGTFYEYFTDVYDVLEQIEQSLIPTLDELPPFSIPSGSIGMPLNMFLKLYEKNSKYYSVLLGDNGDPAFVSKLKISIKPTIMQVFESNSNVDKQELEYILEYTLSAMIGVMSYWLKQINDSSSENSLCSEDLIGLIQNLMENGVMKQLLL
jgi:AcrR family transcriptional regulator